jgi:hypothetical protein
MKKTLMMVVVVGFGLVAGCGKKGSDLASEAAALSAKACACPDKACFEKVEAEWKAWEKAARQGPKPSEAVMTAIKAAEKAGGACEDALEAKAKAAAGSAQ